jgi:hypothetical protein
MAAMNKHEIAQPAAFILPYPAPIPVEREESNVSSPLLAMPIPDDDIAPVDTSTTSSTAAEHHQDPSNQPASSSGKKKRKKAPQGFRKAPQAPRRFKSPYILFSISRMEEYKREKGTTSVTAISRLVAEEWKALSPADRKKWDQVAAQDKARYNAEKTLYTGPWQVPSKRSKKVRSPSTVLIDVDWEQLIQQFLTVCCLRLSLSLRVPLLHHRTRVLPNAHHQLFCSTAKPNDPN